MVKGIIGLGIRLHRLWVLWLRISLLPVGLVLWLLWIWWLWLWLLLIGWLLLSSCLLLWDDSVGREIKGRLLLLLGL